MFYVSNLSSLLGTSGTSTRPLDLTLDGQVIAFWLACLHHDFFALLGLFSFLIQTGLFKIRSVFHDFRVNGSFPALFGLARLCFRACKGEAGQIRVVFRAFRVIGGFSAPFRIQCSELQQMASAFKTCF